MARIDAEEKNLLQDEAEIIQLVIFKGPQDGAIAGTMKGGHRRQSHEEDGELHVVAEGKEKGDHANEKANSPE